MEDEIMKRVFEGGRERRHPASMYSSVSPPPRTTGETAGDATALPSILQSLPLHASFDHGYYLLVKAIQELREKKDGRVVTVGIGGPSGSGKTSLTQKVASVLGCLVISMEHYRNGSEDANELDSIDFDALVQNIKELVNVGETMLPLFDFQEKRRISLKQVNMSSSGVVVVDGTYALHSILRSLLDIRVAVVGGVHFSLLSKVQHDIGDSCSLDYLIDSIFPLFRKNIEPDLHHAQIRINNSFVSSFREAYYKLKCRNDSIGTKTSPLSGRTDVEVENFIEMYLRPPFASEEARISDWIKVRQCGIRYYLSLGDQRIVDKNFIIRPKAEFEVGRTTLGGLLALGYNVVVSYKRVHTSVHFRHLLLALENIDTLNETFMVLKGTNRNVVRTEASNLGIEGPWITKSYLEMILESRGVPRLNTPPPLSSALLTGSQERTIASSRPIRLSTNFVHKLENLIQPWTRSPRKSNMDPLLARWNFISDSSAYKDNIQLVPLPDSYDLDRGLLLSIQAIQALLENKGFPIIVGIGGLSGSGKTSLAHKMANIIGCEVISLESYYRSEQVRDFKYDEFNSLDLTLLSKNIDDIKIRHKAKVPCFDFENCSRHGFKEIQVSEDCGVVIFEGVYALHPDIRKSLDLWVAVLKIRNDFDPVLSAESSLFVLKCKKQVAYQDILKVLDPGKVCSSVQNFIDIYLKLPGTPSNGQLRESDCIRVRICEGRFALLIREPMTEGNFIIQPKVDFDISVSTVSGLLNLGYQAIAYIEASAMIYQDGKILIEVDHLHTIPHPFLQIKGTNKEVVLSTAAVLCLDGSYTTKTYLQIVLENFPTFEGGYNGIPAQQATRLHELVEFIQSQGAFSSSSESSPNKVSLQVDAVVEDLRARIKRLERWQAANMVLWTFMFSALSGYALYHRRRHGQ